MSKSLWGILAIGAIVVVVLVVVLIANRAPRASQLAGGNVTDMYAIRKGNGYELTWDPVKGVKYYNLYLFKDALNSLDKSIRGRAIHSIQNIQSPYYLDDSVLNAVSTDSLCYLSITSVKNYKNAEIESDLCRAVAIECTRVSHLDSPVLQCSMSFFDPSTSLTPPQNDVETCFQKDSDDTFYMQWHPVTGAAGYIVYANLNMDVTTTSFTQRYELPKTAYNFNTEAYPTTSCFSFIVTALDKYGRETLPSQMFTNCPP